MQDINDFVINNDGWLIEYTGKSNDVRIPEGVKEISFRTFYRSDIRSVEIPKSVWLIDVQAFLCCNNLRYIVIPNSVTAMEYAVFEDCANLTDIYVEAQRGFLFGYDWDYGCNAAVHYAGEWEYVGGVPKVK